MIYRELRDGVPVSRAWNGTFDETYDVIVAGLGTAGAMSAILCARQGLSVLGLEILPCMGGTGTAGGIENYYYGNPGGHYRELDREAGMPNFHSVEDYGKRRVLDRHARAAGAVLRFDVAAAGVYLEGNKIVGLSYLDDGGLRHVGAKVVIDATAQGTVCQTAGCAMRPGRDSDHSFQPYSYVFFTGQDGRVCRHNMDSGHIDPYDPFAYSAEILSTAADARHLWERYDGETPLLGFSPIIGIREGRTIVGEESVTMAQAVDCLEPPSPVFFGYSNVDHHGKDTAFEDEIARDWLSIAGLWGICVFYAVPMGALVPRGFDGLLAAGRHVSVEHSFAPALRMKDEMQKAGEAAAVMTGLSIRSGCPLHRMPHEAEMRAAVREALFASGCLSPADRATLAESRSREPIPFLTEAEEIRAGLNSNTPGIAIWSARREYPRLRDALRAFLQAGEPLLRRHAALALALCGDDTGAAVLLEMIADKGLYIPKSSRKYNPPHAVSAIAAAGKLALAQAVPMLLEVIENPAYTDALPWEPDELIDSRETLYFLYFTQAQTALQQIALRHPTLRREIAARLAARLAAPDFSLIVGLKFSNLLVEARDTARRVFDRSGIAAETEN